MNTRERFRAIMNFQPYDRLPILEWAGWWDKTLERWRAEGLPMSLQDGGSIQNHFGLDLYKQLDWFGIRWGEGWKKVWKPGIVWSLEEYDRVKSGLFLKQPIDEKKWEPFVHAQQRGDAVLWFTLDGFFWGPRGMMGVEPHLYAFYDHPEVMHRINADIAEWMLDVIERVCAVCKPDFMTFGEDMSYNHGPMISHELFNEFMLPYYRKVIPVLKKNGIIPLIDSDGDISVPAHWFTDAGLEGILPLERQAGTDIAALRASHPTMKFIGHFDKMTMNQGENRMREEFERLLPTAARGGFIISCDHQTPPGVSYQDYQLYVRLFREYAEKAGAMSRNRVHSG